MVNQVNKKRRNLVKDVRAQKKAYKSSTRSTSVHEVARLNKVINEDDSSNVVFRAGKMGKNNAMIKPVEISRKKLRKIVRDAKIEKSRLRSKGLIDTDMMDSDMVNIVEGELPAKSKKKKGKKGTEDVDDGEMETEVMPKIVATPKGAGTTLGRPGVLF
ncbi:hypothetical protein HDU76_012004 [Blyttiomyces sp. JEL0837]|nr:hypothetical protein HDU76_012004 [Blyttiomyces sp. JEL0837]